MFRLKFISLTLVSALVALPAMVQAQSADEIAKRFKSQQTRGLVLVPADKPKAAPKPATTAKTTPKPATKTTSAKTSRPKATAPKTVAYTPVSKDSQVNVSIQFDFNSAILRAEEKPKLATLCQVMNSIDVKVFQVVGHTDSSGSAAYNQELSRKRAEEVKRHLVRDCGIAPSRLVAVGVGEDYPFNTSNPRADENRRVEFQALG